MQAPVSVSQAVTMALDLARDVRAMLKDPDEVIARAKLVRRKLPSIVKGLKTIGKNDKAEALSIGSLLETNARERGSEPAVLYEDQVFSHAELHDISNRYANLFHSMGIRKGDAVAVLLENRPEILFAVAGAVKLGAVAAVINTKQRHNVLLHSFRLCDAKAFVVGEELYPSFEEVRQELPAAERKRVLFVPDSGELPPPTDAIDAEAAVAAASRATPSALYAVRLGDPCFYIYTSGTTGLPKASIMSHFRWIKASGAFGMLALDMRPTDRMYIPLPFYHNNALTVGWSSTAAAGASLVIKRRFSASKFWDDVRRYDANVFCYIGELCRYLMNQPAKPNDADNPITKIVGNGLRPDIWKEFKRRFAIDEVYEFYAASEGNVAFVNILNLDCTVGICPAPYAIIEYDVDNDEPVRAPDGHFKRVARGGTGLLIAEVSDKYSFDGYTDRAASEKKLLRDVFAPGDVWFNSGDLVRDQGFKHVQFVDRVGDTFRWKSENVSTNEVAEVCNQFHQVAETTVYGVHIPGTEGRAGMAAIVARVPVDAFDLAAFTRHLRQELPPYAVPLFLRFRPELEVTGTFKQVKGALRGEGFDPAKVKDPVYVMLPRSEHYDRMTDTLAKEIAAGQIPF
jgi:acyl-CoA synthetase (AMP-forming)/AMP-acid ligase II